MLEKIKIVRRKILRQLEMRPIHKVICLLKKHDYLLMDSVLEVFGYKGEYHTMDYVKYVNQLDIWEINPDCEIHLKNNLPRANVKITNSYVEIKQTGKLYETIIVDNHQGLFGDNKCEHFEIIEDCLNKLQKKAVLIINVIPDIDKSKYKTPQNVRLTHVQKRKDFYNHPHGVSLTEEEMVKYYSDFVKNNGFIVDHIFLVKRNYLMTYLVLCLRK